METAITFLDVTITGGFWADKYQLVRQTTLWAVYERFRETGRFSAFDAPEDTIQHHIFGDSDVAKWIEGVAYFLEKEPCPDLEAIVDRVAEGLNDFKQPNGYFNSHFTIHRPNEEFHHRSEHELYCAGHWMEAAVAYHHATGKDVLLRFAEGLAELIYKAFVRERSARFYTPGHEEIELALVRLYRYTGNHTWLELSRHFVEERGRHGERLRPADINWHAGYAQDHLPVRMQKTAEGHAVRACYLYAAMADLALELGDESLHHACHTLFQNIITRRMYITGGIGSASMGEAFTLDYDLPNREAYAESCAAISLAMFALRMQRLEPGDSQYADIVERILYNGFLSSISLSGDAFFYENPLEIDLAKNKRLGMVTNDDTHHPDTRRKEVFDCSCCPPNIVRFIGSIGDWLAHCEEGRLYLDQYMDCRIQTQISGQPATLEVHTQYPRDGEIHVCYHGPATWLALRVPDWCVNASLAVNGGKANSVASGYQAVQVTSGDVVDLVLDMTPAFVQAHPALTDNAGRVAVMRGPVVYCAEQVDNVVPIRAAMLDARPGKVTEFPGETLGGLPILLAEAEIYPASETLYHLHQTDTLPAQVQMIPYHTFANREETDMLVWMLDLRAQCKHAQPTGET